LSIREYLPGEHKGGFKGLRVVVKVGDDYRQKYFAYKGTKNKRELAKIMRAAEKLNAEWNMERILTQSKKELECRENRRISSAYTTGVSGIKMKFTCGHKTRGEKRKSYYTAHFRVSGSTAGVRFDANININRHGYDMAWLKAVMYYAGKKGITNFSHLLERKPPVEQFIIIYKHQTSLGHKIPLHRLPAEIDPEFIAKI
jgi:hypothetical protein